MSILWCNSNDGRWIATELPALARLSQGTFAPLDEVERSDEAQIAGAGDALIYRQRGNHDTSVWLLLAPTNAGIGINETPLETGLRILRDRDAIRLADAPTMYFSTERLARIEAFAGTETVCPRCRLEINAGDAAVRCPACGVWHHERVAEGQNCWTYAKTCALCDQPTDLERAELRWTPERL